MTRSLAVLARLRGSLVLAVGVGMAGCAGLAPQAPAPQPPAAPMGTAAPADPYGLRAHYAALQTRLLSQGLLRRDGGGRDTPYSARMLAENFVRIALYDEYASGPSGPVQRMTHSRLRRWAVPVRLGLRFGASVPADVRAQDRAAITAYAASLSRLSGHLVQVDDRQPNFWVYVVDEDERRALVPQFQADVPGLGPQDLAVLRDMPTSTYCLVYAMAGGAQGAATYSRAVAIVRAEHPDLLRLSCYHEEIAQGLGLANDSPLARPSIFNDDEEFALLTRMDAQMLGILYSPALAPGMTETEARPIVESLAARAMGGAQ